jgi:hypothetical protein
LGPDIPSILKFETDAHARRTGMLVGWLFVFAALVLTIFATVRLGLTCECDLAPIYAGSKCLFTVCSPYDAASLEVVMERQGYFSNPNPADWSTILPVYPPPTLALALPLALLRYSMAEGAMYFLSLASLFVALYLVYVRSAWLAAVSPMLRGLIFGMTLYAPRIRLDLSIGNPALPSFTLLTYCCFDTAESTLASWRRAVLFSIACILKPHFALPMVLVLAVKPQDGWPTVRRAAIILTIFTAAVLVWFHIRFGTTIWVNALAGSRALARATTRSPVGHETVQGDLVNLEYLIGYWVPQAGFRLYITGAVLLVLASALLLGIWRLRRCIISPRVLMLAIACVAACTLLPIYHGSIDCLLLCIAAPWVVTALHQRKTIWAAGTSLILLAATWVFWVRHLPAHIRGAEGVSMPSSLLGLLIYRSDSICTLLLSAVLIATLLYEGRPMPIRAATNAN